MSANRISYTLGLQGPSILIDTACSSALVALDLAAAMLCRASCACGIVLAAARPVTTAVVDVGHMPMLALSGRCRTFDASADGYVLGEGCGAVFVHPASAERNQRVLHTAVNQDGRSSTVTAANCRAQLALLSTALLDAGVSADDVGSAECHGTGTPLGDPMEVAAVARVLRAGMWRAPVTLGAVKTNIGHLACTSG